MSGVKRNFYEILNATSTASVEELKSNYKQLILQCHPDKLLQQQQHQKKHQHETLENNSDKLEIDDPNNAEFVAITEAWNCLKDPNKRKQYDAELLLNKFHTHNNIYAHIKLSEMKKQINTGEYYTEEESTTDTVEDDFNTPKYLYTYECRCGGQYIVDESAEQYCRIVSNHGTKIKNNDYNKSVDDENDADNQSQNKSSPNEIQYKNSVGVAASGSGGAGASSGTEGVVFNEDNSAGDDEEGGELIVECTECSLVIILNG